jgi:hypothetical protein
LDAHGMAAVAGLDVRETVRRLGERLIPAHLLPGGSPAAHWPAEAIRILLKVLERHGLRTDARG